MNIDDRMDEAKRPDDSLSRKSTAREYRWDWDKDRGEWIMPELQRKFLEEFCMVWPRPDTQLNWAKEHGVNNVTVSRWKKDPRFINEWHRLSDQSHAHPEFWKPVIDRLRETALKNPAEDMNATQVRAAKLFFDTLEKITPDEDREREVRDDRLEEIMDEELEAMMEAESDNG